MCTKPFRISPYTSNIDDNCEQIAFPIDCFAHPVHSDCLFHYRHTIMKVKNITDLNCLTCKRRLVDDIGFIYFNSMYPPPSGCEPPNPQLPLAPVIPLGQNYELLLNFRSGCCDYPHFRGELFIVAAPCGHSMHTRCYLDLLLGDLSWINTPERNPTGPVHCPTCQVQIEYVSSSFAKTFPGV